MTQGRIFDIERFSTADGPGIRTVVFFKGCNLHCYWCHNPESIRPNAELELDDTQCIGCGLCAKVCPHQAHDFSDGHRILREKCKLCFGCADACPPGALKRVGREISVEACMDEIRQDAPFYSRSGGGVTLSGGEVLMQAPFAVRLLEACKGEGIRTAIESNLAFPREQIEPLLPHLDLIMADIKHMDPQHHRLGTGQSNEGILENLLWLDGQNIPLIIRTPVIPGFNDDAENIAKTARFLSNLQNLQYYELLSYNPMGNDKRRRFGYAVPSIPVPGKQQMHGLAQAAAALGLPVWVDGTILV